MVFATCEPGCGLTLLREGGKGQQGTGTEPRVGQKGLEIPGGRSPGGRSPVSGKRGPNTALRLFLPLSNVPSCHRTRCRKPADPRVYLAASRAQNPPALGRTGTLESPGPNKILGVFDIIQLQSLGKEKKERNPQLLVCLQAPGRLSLSDLLRQQHISA